MPPIRAWRRVSRPTRCRSTAARDNRGRAAAPQEQPAVDHELPATPRAQIGRAESSAGPAADKDCVERAFVLAPDVDDRLRLLLELGDEPGPGRCFMKRTKWLQGTRKMRFEDAYGDWQSSRLTQEEAARLLGVYERTFRRYIDRYEDAGLEGLIDKRLSQVSHRRGAGEGIVGGGGGGIYRTHGGFFWTRLFG